MKGAGPIHDFELARIGATTESVARYIRSGEFGLWRETGEMNDIVREGAAAGLGLGESLGKAIVDGDHIYGVIKGSALNNDGGLKVGYLAPRGDGQAAVAAEAIAMSGVEFQTDRGTRVHGSMGFAGGTGGDEGYGVGINDLGQVAFSASFTSPAAVYLSDRVAVPEPSSMVLISIFVCCMLCGWHANRSVRQS